MDESTAPELAETPPFVGDGNYVGDGGELLQRLWDFAPWKMIRNCPGRYIIKHRKRSPLLIDGVPVTAIDTEHFVRLALSSEGASSPPSPIVVHDLQSPCCLDPVKVVVFGAHGSGGGVITYYKRENPEADQQDGGEVGAKEEATVYVHTLNTASGLSRKLGGLQLAHVLEL